MQPDDATTKPHDSQENNGRLAPSPLLRWSLTLLLLLVIAFFIDLHAVARELGKFSALVLPGAMLASVCQVVVSAWRWRYTASRLALRIPLGVAIKEYYLATFLNQVLPGGVLGDINRAWRQSQDSGARLASVHAVMMERLSGQLVLVAIALASGVWLALNHPGFWHAMTDLGGVLLTVAVAVLFLAAVSARVWTKVKGYFQSLVRDIRKTLLGWPTWLVQATSSACVVFSYLAVFLLLAWDAGYCTDGSSALVLAALCTLLLLAMVLPATVAGWGIRESAAALLWPLAGLPAEQGVALSVGYGLTVLISSLPGALFLFRRR